MKNFIYKIFHRAQNFQKNLCAWWFILKLIK